MNLIDTVDKMTSTDYKERFQAEYMQLKIRVDGLGKMLEKYQADTLPFTPTCSYDMLHEQYVFMKGYQYCLEGRAKEENIEL